jgi:hypothetical protein
MLSLLSLFALLLLVPGASAQPLDDPTLPFPDIAFHDFVDFVRDNFSGSVSLSVVLSFVLTVLRNPLLISLHYWWKLSLAPDEQVDERSNWGTALAEEMLDTWPSLLPSKKAEVKSRTRKAGWILDAIESFVELARLDHQLASGAVLAKIDETAIQTLRFLVPPRVSCRTRGCHELALKRLSNDRDVPSVALICGTQVFKASVLAGQCTKCRAFYYPDHETHRYDSGPLRYYPSDSAYLKAGQNLWVDRQFALSVLYGLYYFASTNSFTNFWLTTYWPGGSLSRRHVWRTFLEISTRLVSDALDVQFMIPDAAHSAVSLVAEANAYLTHRSKPGSVPVVPLGFDHACSSCEKPYVQPTLDPNVDSAALCGSEGRGDRVPSPAPDTQPLDDVPPPTATATTSASGTVRLRVLDGIVAGPLVCLI